MRPSTGRRLKTFFTILPTARYVCGMVILAAFALAATAAPQAPVQTGAQAPPVTQARAVVRIVAAARLRFAEIERTSPETLREARVRAPDGSVETVRLVEFE